MRTELVTQYHKLCHKRSDIVNPNACGIQPRKLLLPEVIELDQAIKKVLEDLLLPENREQPKDQWEVVHGFWLTVAMPDDGYLPGELLKITTSTSIYDGNMVRAGVLCESCHKNGRIIALMLSTDKKYELVGAEQVTPGSWCI